MRIKKAIMEENYKTFNEKEKKKILNKISKVLKDYNIKNYSIFGSFVSRNYARDLDIVIFDNVNEKKLIEIAKILESKIGIEVDLKRANELKKPILFYAITKGIVNFDEKTRRNVFGLLNECLDFNEWLRKWM
jgi:predicted nucleotidyltransferase